LIYKLVFLTSAQKEFKRLDSIAQKLIKEKLLLLAKDPEIVKNNLKSLQGNHKGKFRLRVGNYRVIIKKEDDKLIITVISVGHRKDIYK